MFQKRYVKLLVCTLMSLYSLNSFSGIESVSYFQRTCKVTANSFALQENKYLNAAYINWGPGANSFVANAFAKISLRLFDTIQVSVPNQDVYFKITGYDRTGSPLGTVIEKLSVSNVLSGANLEDKKDIDLYVFNGAHRVEVKITDAAGVPLSIAAINALPINLAFEIQVEVERYYLFNALSVLTTAQVGHNVILNASSSLPEELEVYWDNLPGAEEYDLEWAFVDDYGASLTTFQSGAAINNKVITFKGNSTRITTSGNSYRIPIVFEHGYIVYRVRGVGVNLNNIGPNMVMEGNWHLQDKQMLSYYISNSVVYQNTGNVHEADKKNWQYNATFAEQGKRKHTVTYADGTLRMRQIITQSNSDKTVIVGQTIYDYQGRKAIETLPVPDPSGQNKFQYQSAFTQNGVGVPYNKNDFDLDQVSVCAPVTPPLGKNSGAGKYYSPNNILSNPNRPYTPDAFGYAFTQTEYKADNTGRIKNQGGVGDNHYIGSGHEIKYLYGSPDQEELDALFGSEVGYFMHYQKNVVIDANGQASISYVDLKGKTIATALAGQAPGSMAALPSGVAAAVPFNATYINDVAGNGSINGNTTRANSLEFNKKIIIEATTSYTINYDVVPVEYNASCPMGTGVCYDCIYGLKLSLIDECRNELVPASSNISGYFASAGLTGQNGMVGDVSLSNSVFMGFKDDGCSNSSAGNKYTSAPIVITLQPGEYLLSKTLTVNDDAMNFYLAKYLQSNCVKKLTDFETESLAGLDTTGCNVPCLDCLENTSLCAANYAALLSDVSMGGQYATYEDNNGVITANSTTSLLNIANTLPKISSDLSPLNPAFAAYHPDWKHPILNGYVKNYEYENGMVAYVPVNPNDPVYAAMPAGTVVRLELDPASGYLKLGNGNVYGVRVKDLKDLSAFRTAWNPNFARFLVEYHPEFSYYQFCITQDGRSEHYFPKKNTIPEIETFRANFESQWKGLQTFRTRSLKFNSTNYTTSVQASSGLSTLSSEEFDEQLRTYVMSINDLSNSTNGFCSSFSAADILNTNAVDVGNDLINIDPYFDATNNPLVLHHVFGTKTQEILKYYKTKLVNTMKFAPIVLSSGLTINNIKEALMLSIADPQCNFQNVFYNTSAVMPSGCGNTITTDEIWNRYKDFYLSSKRQILFEMADEFAKVAEYGIVFGGIPAGNQNYLYRDPSSPSSSVLNPASTYFDQLTANHYPGSYSLPTNYRVIKGYNGCIGNPSFDANNCDFLRDGISPMGSNYNASSGTYNYAYPAFFNQAIGFQANYYNDPSFVLFSSPISLPWNSHLNLLPVNGWGYFDRGQTCNADLAGNFATKTKRFQSGLGYAQQTYGTSAVSAADLGAILGTQVSYENQQLGGVCPLANDLKGLLSNMFQGISSGVTGSSYDATHNAPLWIFPGFTKLLYDNIIDHSGPCASDYVFLQSRPTLLSGGQVLSLDLFGNTTNAGYHTGTLFTNGLSSSSCVNCTSGNLVTLTLPGTSYNFSDIVSVDKIMNVVGSTFNLQITYTLTSGSNVIRATDIISGTSCFPLEGCVASPAPQVCEITTFGKDLVNLLSALGSTYNDNTTSTTYYTDLFNTVGVDLTNSAVGSYANYFTTSIYAQLGLASHSNSWFWKELGSPGNFQIYSPSTSDELDIKIFSGPSALTLISGYTYDFTNLRVVSGQAHIDVTTTNLASPYNTSTSTYVITVTKNPGSNSISLFDCHPVTDPLCSKIENRNFVDLKPFLAEILPMWSLGGYNNNITNVNSFTNSLKSQLPGGIMGTYFLAIPYFNTSNPNYTELVYNIAMLKPGYAKCGESWTYGERAPECMTPVCEVRIKDVSGLPPFTNMSGWETMLSSLDMYTLANTKNTNVLCGYLTSGIVEGEPQIRNIEVTTCWNVEKCCTQPSIVEGSHVIPKDDCSREYKDFFSSLDNTTPAGLNIVINASAINVVSSIPYSRTDSYVSQKDFCTQGYYKNYTYYLDYYNAIVSKLNALNASLPGSMQYVNPLTDPSSKFYYSVGNFLSNSNLYRLIEYLDYLQNFTLPSNISDFNPDNLMNFAEYMSAYNQACTDYCGTALNIEPTPSEPLGWNTDCVQELQDLAAQNAQIQYQQYIDQIASDFKNAYIAACMLVKENLNTQYNSKRHHYTLYYYDQAGNLIKTVPPNGVALFTSAIDLSQVVNTRNQNATAATPVLKVPPHALGTIYKYNSLNQLTNQTMPDHGYNVSDFYYDRLGRLILSQNPKQKHGNGSYTGLQQYSYTKYDALGRITEVGEMNALASAITPLVTSGTNQIPNALSFNNIITSATRQQITSTIYDYPTVPLYGFVNCLRGRVSSTSLDADGDGMYENSSHYNYDVHGNVKSLLNVFNYAGYENIENKRIDYTYDLIGGKVNTVAYQKGEKDQYLHAYYYDADNRIIEVQTSKDGYIWNKDAKYYYYLHGPLARTETGDRKVQGQDYYYTIQGWIKGVNGEAFIRKTDPGKDGYLENSASDPLAYTATTKNLHGSVAIDAAAYSLGYYEATTGKNKDYVPIKNNGSGAYDPLTDPYASIQPFVALGNFTTKVPNLYNGNIKHMGTSLVSDLLNKNNYYRKGDPLFQGFKYDQLNRLIVSNASVNYATTGNSTMNLLTSGSNQWNSAYTITGITGYTYDPNGNINNLKRAAFTDGSHAFVPMDDMNYSYISNNPAQTNLAPNTGGYNTNKLDNVTDGYSLGNGDFTGGQSAGNYKYDEIGNLNWDSQEFISNIEWNVYGKISKITHSGANAKSDLEFRYNSMGERIMKIVKPRVAGALQSNDRWKYTIYMRDAQGNVMSVYETSYTNPSANHYTKHTKLLESHLYGSSRLGMDDRNFDQIEEFPIDMTAASGNFATETISYSYNPIYNPVTMHFGRELGHKNFELSNHLGNVHTTISDKKIAVDAGIPNSDNLTYTGSLDSKTDYYIADITSVTDYYPFGSPISSRKWQANSNYRYGFNGKENDNEINSGTQDFGAREYDSRLGRFFTQDKFSSRFAYQSPYVFAGNSPISGIDVNGDSLYILTYTSANHRGDDMFEAAALTRKYDIEHSIGFNPKTDKVVVIAVQDLSDIENKVNSTVAENKATYGNTVEFDIWSHSSLDGPTGTAVTSNVEDRHDDKQMKASGWAKIDFNWSSGNNRAGFYGCRAGLVAEHRTISFTTEMSGLANFKDVTVFGQSNYSFPSKYTDSRSPSFGQMLGEFLPIEFLPRAKEAYQYQLRKTYMVAGGKENMATEKSAIFGISAQKMNFSKNGKQTNSNYQAGDKK